MSRSKDLIDYLKIAIKRLSMCKIPPATYKHHPVLYKHHRLITYYLV